MLYLTLFTSLVCSVIWAQDYALILSEKKLKEQINQQLHYFSLKELNRSFDLSQNPIAVKRLNLFKEDSNIINVYGNYLFGLQFHPENAIELNLGQGSLQTGLKIKRLSFPLMRSSEELNIELELELNHFQVMFPEVVAKELNITLEKNPYSRCYKEKNLDPQNRISVKYQSLKLFNQESTPLTLSFSLTTYLSHQNKLATVVNSVHSNLDESFLTKAVIEYSHFLIPPIYIETVNKENGERKCFLVNKDEAVQKLFKAQLVKLTPKILGAVGKIIKTKLSEKLTTLVGELLAPLPTKFKFEYITRLQKDKKAASYTTYVQRRASERIDIDELDSTETKNFPQLKSVKIPVEEKENKVSDNTYYHKEESPFFFQSLVENLFYLNLELELVRLRKLPGQIRIDIKQSLQTNTINLDYQKSRISYPTPQSSLGLGISEELLNDLFIHSYYLDKFHGLPFPEGIHFQNKKPEIKLQKDKMILTLFVEARLKELPYYWPAGEVLSRYEKTFGKTNGVFKFPVRVILIPNLNEEGISFIHGFDWDFLDEESEQNNIGEASRLTQYLWKKLRPKLEEIVSGLNLSFPFKTRPWSKLGLEIQGLQVVEGGVLVEVEAMSKLGGEN